MVRKKQQAAPERRPGQDDLLPVKVPRAAVGRLKQVAARRGKSLTEFVGPLFEEIAAREYRAYRAELAAEKE